MLHLEVCRIRTFVPLGGLSFRTFVALGQLLHYEVQDVCHIRTFVPLGCLSEGLFYLLHIPSLSNSDMNPPYCELLVASLTYRGSVSEGESGRKKPKAIALPKTSTIICCFILHDIQLLALVVHTYITQFGKTLTYYILIR